jgi:hypothetical protein
MPTKGFEIVSNFAGTENCVPFWLPFIMPCWIWVFIQWAFVTALFSDALIYWIYPRYMKRFIKNKFGNKVFHPVDNLQLIAVNKIETTFAQESVTGFSLGVGIEIHNENNYEISECFGTLESIQEVSIKDNRLDCKQRHWLNNLGLTASRKLRWANQNFGNTNCKISLPAKSKENKILVAEILNLGKIVKKGKKQDVVFDDSLYFHFAFCESNPRAWQGPGLYNVRVRINGKVLGKQNMSDVIGYFEGYIYSYIEKNSPTATTWNVYWSEKPLENQKIIKDPRVLRD